MPEPILIDDLAATLDVGDHELISVVGGGGKTTTLFALGRQLSGSVVLTTTTKMGRERTDDFVVLLDPSDQSLTAAVNPQGAVLVWQGEDDHRALGVAPETCDRWFGLVDHVVVEADGARRKPFKAPLAHEPVIPAATTMLVAAIGASALGQPIDACCQRPERVAEIAGCGLSDVLTPRRAAAVLLSDDGSRKDCPAGARFVITVHRVDSACRALVDELDSIVGSAASMIAVATVGPTKF